MPEEMMQKIGRIPAADQIAVRKAKPISLVEVTSEIHERVNGRHPRRRRAAFFTFVRLNVERRESLLQPIDMLLPVPTDREVIGKRSIGLGTEPLVGRFDLVKTCRNVAWYIQVHLRKNAALAGLLRISEGVAPGCLAGR